MYRFELLKMKRRAFLAVAASGAAVGLPLNAAGVDESQTCVNLQMFGANYENIDFQRALHKLRHDNKKLRLDLGQVGTSFWRDDAINVGLRYTPYHTPYYTPYLGSSSMPNPPAYVVAEERNSFLVNPYKTRLFDARCSLAQLSERGFKPTVPLSFASDTGSNGWLFPLFKEHFDLNSSTDPQELFAGGAAIDALNAIRGSYLDRLDIQFTTTSSSVDIYADLLDASKPDVVAIFGNAATLKSLAGERSTVDFPSIPASEFFEIDSPDLHRKTYLQAGLNVDRVSAIGVIAQLMEILNSGEAEFLGCSGMACHEFDGAYSTIPRLGLLTDGGFLVRLAHRMVET